MTPFLKQVAEKFFEVYGAELRNFAFVFPNRRAGIFFKKYLSEVAKTPIFAPTTLTINDLFIKLDGRQQADKIKLLFMLYDIYRHKSGSDDSFDDFFYWGEILLNDFDDIDKYLVDARQLFTNVKDINNIERDFSFMTPTQVQAIRTFWSSFRPKSNNEQSFLRIWELLYPIYTGLRDALNSEGLAYEGMMYRDVANNLDDIEAKLDYDKIVFVGFNALTQAEKELMKALKNRGIADFYWDYSSEMIKDEDNKASRFVKENLRMFPSGFELEEVCSTRAKNAEPSLFDELETTTATAEKTYFETIGIPSNIGQAKQIYPIIKELISSYGLNETTATKTAIVLPNEKLLMPVLNSIPEDIKQINITLGYSLSGTPISSLAKYLQSLQKNVRKTDGEASFYHRDVIALLGHKYISNICPQEASAIINDITEHNRIFVPASSLKITPLLSLIFAIPDSNAAISQYLLDVLKEINAQLSQISEADDYEDKSLNTKELEQEFIFHFHAIVNRMKDMIRENKLEMTSDTYFKLLKQMTDNIKIPFRGEPLLGLQIMGVLETRVLDFENLIILSVNEGVFPSKSASNSFIPYNLRHGFRLPTPEYQDSIRAYHFYRMISRAKRVIMLYDTRTEGLQSGEVSRFVHQLRYHYKIPVRQKLSVYNVSSSFSKSYMIDKNEAVMQELRRYESDKSLSASAINTYLDCPLKFYFSYVKGIKEEAEVSENLEFDTFGTILHRVIELIYKPFCGKTITADILKLAAEERSMTEIIELAFAKDFFHYEKPRPLVGQAYLYGETIRKYARKILEYDRKLTPFAYINSEMEIKSSIEIADGRKILLRGFIDRIDSKNDSLRIVDYKSGRFDSSSFDSLESLFDPGAKKRRKAIMQIFFYTWIYEKINPATGGIRPTLYYIRNLFADINYDPYITFANGKDRSVVEDFGLIRMDFEDNLRKCVGEIFDYKIPFTQAIITENCRYCPFAEICCK